MRMRLHLNGWEILYCGHVLYMCYTVFVYRYVHSYWLDHVLLNSEGAQNAELCSKLHMLIIGHELIRTESHVTVCC